jgi:transposase-like protein
MVREDDIQAALADLDNSDTLNYAATARKHNIHPSTLSRRHRQLTRSREEYLSQSRQLLSTAEEHVLLDQIDRLGKHGLHPTSQMIVNMVEEHLQRELSKNWIYAFLNRHQDRITGVYLKGFDKDRHASESTVNVAHFFENVSYLVNCSYFNTNY